MIACGVFFMAIFAILELVSTLLRDAGRLRHVEVDAGLAGLGSYTANSLPKEQSRGHLNRIEKVLVGDRSARSGYERTLGGKYCGQ